jgi:hypothetical protein
MEEIAIMPQRTIPCFLCGNGLEIRTSKTNKPYLICEICGMQIFVRGKRGISLLNTKEQAIRSEKCQAPGERVLEITALSNRLRELREMLEKIELESFFEIFGKQPPEKAAVEAEIKRVEARLEHLSKA